MVEAHVVRAAWFRASRLVPLLVVLLALFAPASLAAQANDAPTETPISASFIGFAKCTDGWTTWGIGVQFPHKQGAQGYRVEYWDGYWQRTETRTLTHDQAAEGDQYANAEGNHYMGVTGGAGGHLGGGECGPVEQPSPGDRFNQGAKAWAIMPANYRPKASLKVEVTIPDGGALVGQTIEAKVKLSAGESALSDVTFAGLSVGGGATITKRPATPKFKLGSGQSKTFTYRVKATKPGATTLSANASGVQVWKGKRFTVRGSDAETLRVAREQLAITIGVAPGEKRLEVDDEGKVVPSTVDVTVRFTNAGTAPITKLSLQRLAPRPVKQGQRLDQIGFGLSNFPMTIGDVAPKSTVEKTLQLEVTGDGKYVFDALASYENPAGMATESTTGGEFEVTVPLLFFTSSIQGQQQVVKAGEPYHVSGYVKNLSTHQHLCLRPLKPTKVGNADFFGPVDLMRYKKHTVVVPPVAGGLKPGERIPWELLVRTEKLGGTRSEVSFDPGAVKVDAGADCDIARVMQQKRIPASLVKTTPDSTDYRLAVDTRDVQYPELSWDGKVYYISGAMVIGFAEGSGTWLQSTFSTAAQIARAGTNPENYFKALMLPYQASTATKQAMENMYAATSVLAQWWRTATPAQRRAYLNDVRTTLENAPENAYASASRTSAALVSDFLNDIERFEANQNDPRVWDALGKRGGSLASQVVIDVALGKAGIAAAEHMAELQHQSRNLLGASKTFRSLKEIPPGKRLNMTEMKKLWGMTAQDVAKFSEIAKKHGVKIAVRGRNPKSVAHLRSGAVWKHENLKPKNVNEIDIKFLNFNSKDDGLVVFKQYGEAEKAAIRQRVANAGLTPEQLVEVNKRIETRFGEADEWLDKIQKMEKEGHIDISFNMTENGFEDLPTPKQRAFTMDRHVDPETGTTTFRPLQENVDVKRNIFGKLPANCFERVIKKLKKVVCKVTGDMDGVYITTAQGGPVEKSLLRELYKDLEEAGWQHPETISWIDEMGKGGFWFNAKAKILAGNQIDGDALAEFSAQGVFASFIDIKASRLVEGAGTQDWWVRIIGGAHPVTP